LWYNYNDLEGLEVDSDDDLDYSGVSRNDGDVLRNGDDNLLEEYIDEDDDDVSFEGSRDDNCYNVEAGGMMQLEHKKSFYEKYAPVYEAVKGTTYLITEEKYQWIVDVLRAPPSKQDKMNARKARATYSLTSNVDEYCITRGGKTVMTYERVYDVIAMAHQKLGHARDIKKNKDVVNEDMGYYGVPRSAVKCFVETCLMVSTNGHDKDDYYLSTLSNLLWDSVACFSVQVIQKLLRVNNSL
jgi:hypothetical protein